LEFVTCDLYIVICLLVLVYCLYIGICDLEFLFRIYLPADATHQALQAGILGFRICILWFVCNLELACPQSLKR